MAVVKEDAALSALFENENLGLDEILKLRGKIYQSNKYFSRFEKALSDFSNEKSRKLSPTKAETRKGVSLWILSKTEDALRVLEDAHRGKESDYFLALAYFDIGYYHKAKDLLAKLYKDSSGELEIVFPYVDVKIKLGEAEEAYELIQKIKKDCRNNAEFHYYSGLALEYMGKYEDAEKEYQSALRIDKNHAPSIFRLAYNSDLNGQDEEAINLYKQIRTESYAYTNALLNMGILYEDKGELEKARECYHKVVASYPNHARARLFLGDVEAAGDMFYDEELKRKELALRQLLNQPLTDFRLSMRSKKLMEKLEVKSLGDLVKKSEEDLLKIENFGQKSLSEIKDLLARRGLTLAIPGETFSIESMARGQVLAAPQKTDSLLNKSVFEIDWSARVRSALDKMKIYTLGDLVQKTEHDFLGVRNFGQTSLDEIMMRLKQMGLGLAQPE
ncbi:MAG: DNA-directed RNA polymerase subunit alpha C-terminal domain-containing protein [Candidatus Brocadiia bacterium]